MSIFNQIQYNTGPGALKMVIHGENGIGKTTLAANAPRPLVLAVEAGIGTLQVPFLRIYSLNDLMSAMTELHQAFRSGSRPFDTVVIDSLDALEAMVWKATCEAGRKQNIEDFGYGKGYVLALQKWAEVRERFQAINDCGVHTIAIAQSNNKTFNDPVYGSYNRTILRLHEKAAGLWRDWADIMGFATQKLSLKNEGNTARAVAMGDRVLEIGSSPAYWSKNRFNMPPTLPLQWSALEQSYLAAFQQNQNIQQQPQNGMMSPAPTMQNGNMGAPTTMRPR